MTYRKLSASLLYGLFGAGVAFFTLGFKTLGHILNGAHRATRYMSDSGTAQLERLKAND